MITLAKLERALDRAKRRIDGINEAQRRHDHCWPPHLSHQQIEAEKAWIRKPLWFWRNRRWRLESLIRRAKAAARDREIEARYEDVE